MKPPFTMATFGGKRTAVLVTAAALLLAGATLARSRKSRRRVTNLSPIECKGDHGKWLLEGQNREGPGARNHPGRSSRNARGHRRLGAARSQDYHPDSPGWQGEGMV
jgi:hypothetical protein